eukprot:3293617-Amphidinium_carterae.1
MERLLQEDRCLAYEDEPLCSPNCCQCQGVSGCVTEYLRIQCWATRWQVSADGPSSSALTSGRTRPGGAHQAK